MEKGRREAGIAKESCWICGGTKKEDTGSESGRIKRGSGIERGVLSHILLSIPYHTHFALLRPHF